MLCILKTGHSNTWSWVNDPLALVNDILFIHKSVPSTEVIFLWTITRSPPCRRRRPNSFPSVSGWVSSSPSSPQCEYHCKLVFSPQLTRKSSPAFRRYPSRSLWPTSLCVATFFFLLPSRTWLIDLKVKWSRRTLSSKSEASVSDSGLFLNLMVADLIQALGKFSSLMNERRQISPVRS